MLSFKRKTSLQNRSHTRLWEVYVLKVPEKSSLTNSRLWKKVSASMSADVAVDLGTANTLVYLKGEGIVLNEPSVVALDAETGELLAVGSAAKQMYGKTSRAIRCVRPIKDGVIADFQVTTEMIKYMLGKVRSRWSLMRPRAVIGVPSDITQVEKRAVLDAALSSGMRQVFLVEESMAAAVGSGLPVSQPVGSMVVDIGGGTTEIAILSLGGTMYSHAIRIAGDEMDEAVQRYVKQRCGLEISIFEAERVKVTIGSLLKHTPPLTMTVFGRDVSTGMPRAMVLDNEVVRAALQEPICAIVGAIYTALENVSPEVAQDILANGVHLAGGGAMLRGLAEKLTEKSGIPFIRDSDPLTCVVRGVGRLIDDLDSMKGLCIAA
jgi:rod shape-determining protein MreB